MDAYENETRLADAALLERLFSVLNAAGITANPYAWDGSYAEQIKVLPIGLRAMAATAYLDISLALDDIGWHFLNFGEPSHVTETEAGLRELGCEPLADLFQRAYVLVRPYLPPKTGIGNDFYARLERDGKGVAFREISEAVARLERASAVVSGSLIYESWSVMRGDIPNEYSPANRRQPPIGSTRATGLGGIGIAAFD